MEPFSRHSDGHILFAPALSVIVVERLRAIPDNRQSNHFDSVAENTSLRRYGARVLDGAINIACSRIGEVHRRNTTRSG